MNESSIAADTPYIDKALHVVEYVAVGIELLAVAVIAIGVIYAIATYLQFRYGRVRAGDGQHLFRSRLGNSLLVGLEILVAADIIRTVALEPNLTNVAILGVLVLVRTFLSWSLVVEMEGRWPWRGAEPNGSGGGTERFD